MPRSRRKRPTIVRLAAREDLDDVPFAAARRLARAHGDAIAVPQHLHLAAREIESSPPSSGVRKPKPSRCAETLPVTRSRWPREAVLARAVAEQLAVANHRPHALPRARAGAGPCGSRNAARGPRASAAYPRAPWLWRSRRGSGFGARSGARRVGRRRYAAAPLSAASECEWRIDWIIGAHLIPGAGAAARAPDARLTPPGQSVHSSPFAPQHAQVAELVDALVSGASGRNTVEVQVLSWAP